MELLGKTSTGEGFSIYTKGGGRRPEGVKEDQRLRDGSA